MRTSESKTIINQELFDVKLPDYQRIIERLVSKYNVVDGSYYEGLVNFKANLVVPKHKWYDYKQGYSELLVKHIIDEAKPLKEHVLPAAVCENPGLYWYCRSASSRQNPDTPSTAVYPENPPKFPAPEVSNSAAP